MYYSGTTPCLIPPRPCRRRLVVSGVHQPVLQFVSGKSHPEPRRSDQLHLRLPQLGAPAGVGCLSLNLPALRSSPLVVVAARSPWFYSRSGRVNDWRKEINGLDDVAAPVTCAIRLDVVSVRLSPDVVAHRSDCLRGDWRSTWPHTSSLEVRRCVTLWIQQLHCLSLFTMQTSPLLSS